MYQNAYKRLKSLGDRIREQVVPEGGKLINRKSRLDTPNSGISEMDSMLLDYMNSFSTPSPTKPYKAPEQPAKSTSKEGINSLQPKQVKKELPSMTTENPKSFAKDLNGLENDRTFQTKLNSMLDKYPGLSKDRIYRVIRGESGFNPQARNGSGASGLFQIMPRTAKGLGTTTDKIRKMSPAQQLDVYDKYLAQARYKGGPLGIIQAAPAYQSASDNTIVYAKGTRAWQQNKPWRGSDGEIRVSSINAYYGY